MLADQSIKILRHKAKYLPPMQICQETLATFRTNGSTLNYQRWPHQFLVASPVLVLALGLRAKVYQEIRTYINTPGWVQIWPQISKEWQCRKMTKKAVDIRIDLLCRTRSTLEPATRSSNELPYEGNWFRYQSYGTLYPEFADASHEVWRHAMISGGQLT